MRAALLILVAILAGCAQSAAEKSDVLASFYPLEFLAKRLAGAEVSVGVVIPSGVEPHDYEPTTTDLVRLSDANLLIVQGAGFEAWLSSARTRNVSVATQGIPLDGSDPHTWLAPALFARMAKNVERGLGDAFPTHAPAFRENAANLTTELVQLDKEYRDGLAHCATPFIITNHEAFGYMASAYNFTQLAITGLSPDAEPDPQTISRVVEAAKARNVSVIFFEDLVSPRVAEIIAKEAHAQTRVLSPVEGAVAGKDYESIMRENLASLREAMRCS